MLTVSVTLTFDRLILKSIGIMYTPIQMSVPNLTNLGQFCVLLSSGQGWSIYQYADSHCDLDLGPIDLKSIGIIYTPRRMSVPNLTNLGQFCV